MTQISQKRKLIKEGNLSSVFLYLQYDFRHCGDPESSSGNRSRGLTVDPGHVDPSLESTGQGLKPGPQPFAFRTVVPDEQDEPVSGGGAGGRLGQVFEIGVSQLLGAGVLEGGQRLQDFVFFGGTYWSIQSEIKL